MLVLTRIACAALALVPAAAVPQTGSVYLAHPYVKQVVCDGEMGTAFKLADGRFVSVNHVTAGHNCQIDGQPITVVFSSVTEDFSILTVPNVILGGFKVNCGGFYLEQDVTAMGFAQGMPFNRLVFLKGTGQKGDILGSTAESILSDGQFIPGMSGGPVLNERGEAVGTVNANGGGLSWSRALADTPLCGVA